MIMTDTLATDLEGRPTHFQTRYWHFGRPCGGLEAHGWSDMQVSSESTAAKPRIVLAAEELFAERGIEGVSMRQVRIAAGNANNSAVGYHFGSKEQLIQSIVEYRLSSLADRRDQLVAQLGTDTVSAWLECQIRTMLGQAETPGSHYVTFLSQLYHSAIGVTIVNKELAARVKDFHARLPPLLADVDQRIRAHRIQGVMIFMLEDAAQRERTRNHGLRRVSLDVAVPDMVNGLQGFLLAPAPLAELGRARVGRTGPLPFIV